jgi:hypothetical protein
MCLPASIQKKPPEVAFPERLTSLLWLRQFSFTKLSGIYEQDELIGQDHPETL